MQIDLWQGFARAQCELTESQEAHLSGLELSLYTKASDILQIHTQVERRLKRAEDNRFWFRFFELDATKVPVEWFAKGMSNAIAALLFTILCIDSLSCLALLVGVQRCDCIWPVTLPSLRSAKSRSLSISSKP